MSEAGIPYNGSGNGRDEPPVEMDSVESFEIRRVELTRSIAANEAELRRALTELKQSATRIMDVGRHIRRRPRLWVGSALAVGFLLGRRR